MRTGASDSQIYESIESYDYQTSDKDYTTYSEEDQYYSENDCFKNCSILFKRLVSPLYLDVVNEFGIQIIPKSSFPKKDATLILYDGIFKIDKFVEYPDSIPVNKIPGLNDICKKHYVFERLNNIKKKDFYPQTFLYPEDEEKLLQEIKSNKNLQKTWIFKPDYGYGGKGIKLCQTKEQYEKILEKEENQKGVFQLYISPRLYRKHKFDFRLFVLIVQIDPLELYIYKGGSARICLKEYQDPNNENLTDMYSHLTSVSINSKGPNSGNFKFILKFDDVFKEICGDEKKQEETWNDIKSLVKETFYALKEDIKKTAIIACEKNGEKPDNVNRFYHLLGLDILIDHNLKPYLLEVNDNPGIRCFSDIDEELKGEMIRGEIKLIYNHIKKNPYEPPKWEII